MEGYYETMTNIHETLRKLRIIYEQTCVEEENVRDDLYGILEYKQRLERDIRILNEERDRLHHEWIREHTYDPYRKMDDVDILMNIQKNGNIKGSIL